MKKITIGILAHVDAGKTTLSEALLYTAGEIRDLGRVDRRDSFLDNNDLERKRGITIFSKQAVLEYKDTRIYLLDTPGHADFSSEMERTLSVLDYAVLVISGTDGAQAQTRVLTDLLESYDIPTIIFITKMDVSSLTKEELMRDLIENVSEKCIDFTENPDDEDIATLSENAFNEYISEGKISSEQIQCLIKERNLIPCYFGSGLKCEGVEKVLDDIDLYCTETQHKKIFAAKVFKISRDNQNKRMTYVKMTGGKISVRDEIDGEKITQIRIYSGIKYKTVDEACAGDVCTFLGLNNTSPGQGLGDENNAIKAMVNPVLSYRMLLDKGTDSLTMLPKIKELEEEDPQLHVTWNSHTKEIHVQLMGEIQIEVLKNLIKERFGKEVTFDTGSILYRETIRNTVEGIGHYEPLKHYAEVHLLMKPGKPGSGIIIKSAVSTDVLDLNWQRLIMTHLKEKEHIGVLTGAPITDIEITVIAGKAHLKHTEGGDFRQATYRAVRNGLMQAENVLLEPVYRFHIEVPQEMIGRAITDIHSMGGENTSPETKGEFASIDGRVPASKMIDYPSVLASYTSGKGKIAYTFDGYSESRESEKIIGESGYDPCADIENTPDSVFCSHGAGINIPWNEVKNYCHIETYEEKDNACENVLPKQRETGTRDIDEKELEEIMLREFGPIKRKTYSEPTVYEAAKKNEPQKKERIIIDGYNVIHAWDELDKLSEENYDLAREKLIDTIANYSAFTGKEVIIVFDAYKVSGGTGSKEKDEKLYIAYTKEGESADMYIERLIDEIGKNENVRVITSDAMIQLSAVRSGVLRSSAREFKSEVDDTIDRMRSLIEK